MELRDTFLQALHESPGDLVSWMALADWLGDNDDDASTGELLRLWLALRAFGTGGTRADRLPLELRVCELLAGGTRPTVPTVTNSVGMTFALVPPGAFWMGAPRGEERQGADERPRHRVEITRPFYLSAFQVTQAQYTEVMGSNPSWFSHGNGGGDRVRGSTANCPVEYLDWEDARAFCRRLSAQPAESAAGRAYRLPTEAEWEYACRGAGTSTTPFHFGTTATADDANFDGQYPYGDVPRTPYRQRPVPVGSFVPNVLGLHDLHGNVWEWCSDWYSPDYYRESPRQDPVGPAVGSERVLRGGSWIDCGYNCRSAFRDRRWAGARVQSAMGARPVLQWQGGRAAG